jgi:hypothetical protein
MKKFTKKLLVIVIALIPYFSFAQTDMFVWNFDDMNVTVDVDNVNGTPLLTEIGTLAGANYFGGINTTCSANATTGSARSHNAWNVNDGYRYTVDATGFTNMNFSICLRASTIATSPGVYAIRASSDAGMNWTPIVSNITFATQFIGANGNLPASFDGQSSIWIEFINTADAAASGTNIRTDNVKLVGCTPTPNNVTLAAANPALNAATITWTNPLACFNEILVVAAPAANTGVPMGDGMSYTANATYTNGTALGNGFVVYKGTGASAPITGLTNGTPYFFKIFTRFGSNWSAGVEVTTTPQDATQTNDYFRTIGTSNWTTASNWESSHDGTTGWMVSTLAPTSLASGINIKNGHTITINSSVSAAKITIENGGVLENATGAIFTLADAAGDDMLIQNGGVFNLTNSALLSTQFTQGTSVIHVQTGGKIKITNTVTTTLTSLNSFPTNTANIWDDASIFEWDSPANVPVNTTAYFPNAALGTVPKLLVTGVTTGFSGGSTNFLLNGLLESPNKIKFGGTGTKTFRDGIIHGDSLVFGNTCGKVTIGNGGTTQLVGTGAVRMPDPGVDIAANSLITLGSNKTFAHSEIYPLVATSVLTFQSGSRVTLGANNLNVIGRTASTGGYVVTNSTGSLLIDSVGTVATLFPVGPTATEYHPATITNTGVIDSFSVNVRPTPIACTDAAYTVNATWNIAEAIPTGSNCAIVFDYTGATAGAMYPTTTGARIAHCNGTTPDYSNGSATATTATGTGFTSFSPFGISNDAVLPVKLVNFTGKLVNTGVQLDWNTSIEQDNTGFEIQKSTNGREFAKIAFVNTQAIGGNSTANINYTFKDANSTVGKNFYRLKQIDINQTSTLSDVVLVNVLPKNKIEFAKIVVEGKTKATVYINSPIKQQVQLVLYDGIGKNLLSKTKQLEAGINLVEIDITKFNSGVYLISANTTFGKITQGFIK